MANPNLPINYQKNTYIGARYVPKFADPTEWNNTKTYEPLTIVTYQGNSYTSKTFVPAGIDILNDTYWANTGNYNAQVEQYRQEVLNIKDEVTQITDELKQDIYPLQRPIIFPKFIQNTDPEGNCAFYKVNNTDAILFDGGVEENYPEILNSLEVNGVKNIVAIVISHYHYDHVGVLSHLNGYINKPLTLYLPHASTRFPETQETLNNILGYFPGATVIYPEENSKYLIEGDSLTFINCGTATTQYWDSTTYNYNNYSMVCYLRHFNSIAMFCGDIEINAQTRIYQNRQYKSVQLLTAPHHTSQELGNTDLAFCLSPSFVYANDAVGIGKWLGFRDVFLGACGSIGAQYFSNSTSFEDVSFTLTPYGIIPPVGGKQFLKGAKSGNHLHFQVDSRSTAPMANGSTQFPWLSLEQAFAHMAPGFTYTIDVANIDSTKDVKIEGAQGVEIVILEGVTIPNLTLRQCNSFIIRGGGSKYVNAKTILIQNSAAISLSYIRPEKLQLSESDATLYAIQGNSPDPNSAPFIYSFSRVVMSNCGVISNVKDGINTTTSIITMDTAMANWDKVTNVYHANGTNNINNVRSSEANITKFFQNTSGVFMGYDPNSNTPLMYQNGNPIKLMVASSSPSPS